jgi:NTP pyrophosphatase (non-canonical NTP hydrolase)
MIEKYGYIYKKIYDKWGLESQERMCIEEMSELTKELCKRMRYKNTDKENQIKDNIIEELADVINCVEQLIYIYGEEKVQKVRKEKLERLFSKYDFD